MQNLWLWRQYYSRVNHVRLEPTIILWLSLGHPYSSLGVLKLFYLITPLISLKISIKLLERGGQKFRKHDDTSSRDFSEVPASSIHA